MKIFLSIVYLILASTVLIAQSPETAGPKTTSAAAKPLVTKIEHFYLTSNDAEKLYNLFRDEFRLPVIWKFSSYGDFASGGLTLGNVAWEFVRETGDRAGADTKFNGIAFEPAGDADEAVIELKRRGIAHSEPDPYKYTSEGKEEIGWVTVDLKGFAPDGTYIFLCEYKQRDRVAEGRTKAANELAALRGGPLGITSLKEIVVGVRSIKDASRQWGKLLDSPNGGAGPVFEFGPGPKVRVVRAKTEGIHSIVLTVRSLTAAKKFLAEKQMLGSENKSRLSIAPAAIGGLSVVLVEN